MANVDFFMDATNGSNLNSGSDQNAAATYTSTNGGWSTVTNIFTPSDGTNPVTAGVTVGQFASVYIDGATVGVYTAKVTAVVNAANGTITLSSTLKGGSAPVTSATARTIKVGGAWKGPNGTSGFPVSLAGLGTLVGTGDHVWFNFKNNASYVMTAQIAVSSSQNITYAGFSSTPRDGGKATIDGGTSGSAYTLWAGSASGGTTHVDLIFKNNGASSNQHLVTTNGITAFFRCVFVGSRGNGISTGANVNFYECEFYGNNLSNTASQAGMLGGGYLVRCYFHDNTGSNTSGALVSASTTQSTFIDCIFDSNGAAGLSLAGTSTLFIVKNCDFYNNGSDGLKLGASLSGHLHVENCNFIKNTGWGINQIANGVPLHFVYNCGFGSGSQINTSGSTTGLTSGHEIGSITYASGVTPWVDPVTGNFTVSLPAANFAGRSTFTETDGTNSGTEGHPDIGAAQSLTGPGGTFGKEFSSGSAY